MHEPYTYLNGLTIADLEDLIEDIKVYLELQNEKNLDYWKDITIICEEELAKLKRLDPTYHKRESNNRREGINQAVSQVSDLDCDGYIRLKSEKYKWRWIKFNGI